MRLAVFATLIGLLTATAAEALCSEATLERDYQQADIVVRATVVSAMRVTDDEPSAAFRARWGEYSPVLLNRLRVREIFKGSPGATINLFQEVSSGRFDVDLGREYLMFFTYYPRDRRLGSITRGAVYVRHACGQSKLWAQVNRADLARLRALARRRR